MSDPRRLLDEGATDLERTLLESAADDGPSPAARAAAAAALGLAAGVGAAAGGAAPTGALGAGAGIKSLALAVVGAAAAVGMALGAGWYARPPVQGDHAAVHPERSEAKSRGAALDYGLRPTLGLNGTRAEPGPRQARPERESGLLAAEPGPERESAAGQAERAEVESPPVHPERSEAKSRGAALDYGLRPTLGLNGIRAEPGPRQARPERESGLLAAEQGTERESEPLAVEPKPRLAQSERDSAAAVVAPAPEAPGPSLSAEVALLDSARVTLTHGDPHAALLLLERHGREFPEPALAPEAAALRIEVLVQQGDRELALTYAKAFYARFPNHPLENRLRSLLSNP